MQSEAPYNPGQHADGDVRKHACLSQPVPHPPCPSPTHLSPASGTRRANHSDNVQVNTGASAGWSASYTVDKVVMILLANFQDHEARGRINNIPQYREYSEAEARDGFSRAKTLHGW